MHISLGGVCYYQPLKFHLQLFEPIYTSPYHERKKESNILPATWGSKETNIIVWTSCWSLNIKFDVILAPTPFKHLSYWPPCAWCCFKFCHCFLFLQNHELIWFKTINSPYPILHNFKVKEFFLKICCYLQIQKVWASIMQHY